MPTRAKKPPEYAELQRLHRVKQVAPETMDALGPELLAFFKTSVAKRQTKMADVSEFWCRLVPETLCDHCALEGFVRGSLTVLVDSSSHLYELKQLLLAGLEQQLLIACRSAGLRKIVLRQGRWYDGDAPADRRIRFPN
jgi:Dna[CI] antecedent, DciA